MHEKSQKNKNLALFDFDGTLCDKDSFTGFIFRVFPKRYILRKGIKLSPWITAYFLGYYPAHRMRPKLFHSIFKAVPKKQIHAVVEDYAQDLLDHLNPSLLQQLKKHQQNGDDVVLVSASVDIYLEPISNLLEVDLICTQTEYSSAHYTGFYRSLDCSCEQKKVRVLEQYDLTEYDKIYAYGNSNEDLAMLSLADYPYLTTQSQVLPPI